MSTPNITPSAKYSGNGVATEFAVPFPYLDKSYVSVYVKRGSATQVKLSSTDFDFTNDTYIVYPKAGSTDAVLTSNDVIVVKRETPVKSDYVFDNQVRLFPEDVMDADDLGFQMIQEQADDINRAVKVSETSSANPDEIIPAVESIYSNLTQISAVGDNIGDINTCASNITDIQNASTNAATATTKASEASASASSAAGSVTTAQGLINGFGTTVTNATSAFNSNATTKTTAFNTNATTKTTAFNTNATSKTNDFNTNATAKQTLVDSAATSAQASATSAQNWAVGTLAQQPNGSAKYWAESINVNNLLKTNQITNCILSAPNGVATYSGNVVNAITGITALVCNGRNADGSLANSTLSIGTSSAITFSSAGTWYLFYTPIGFYRCLVNDYIISVTQPAGKAGYAVVWYNPDANTIQINLNNAGWTAQNLFAKVATLVTTGTTITSFTPEQPVQLVKMSDKETVVGWGMPDYSAGVSKSWDTLYTADVDGYIMCSANGNFRVYVDTAWQPISFESYSTNVNTRQVIPIAKGSTYKASGGSTNYDLKFVPCKGV